MKETTERKYEINATLAQMIIEYMGKKPYGEVREIMIPFDVIIEETNRKLDAEQKTEK